MFFIRVIGANGKQTEKMRLSSNSKYYEPGSVHKVVLPGDVIGKPESVEITWEYQTSMFNPLTWRFLHTPRAYIDSLTIDNLEFDHGYVPLDHLLFSNLFTFFFSLNLSDLSHRSFIVIFFFFLRCLCSFVRSFYFKIFTKRYVIIRMINCGSHSNE